MMKPEKEADALLKVARDWQNVELTTEWSICTDDLLPRDVLHRTMEEDLLDGASAALSEVAGMGYDLQNEDGTDCEKVWEVDPENSSGEYPLKLREVRR